MNLPVHVLILCTGNSARSILSEAILNHIGSGRFLAMSAGSHPTGKVNPLALSVLEEQDMETAGFRSKSWDEFTGENAPPIDLVITVCDNAAGETCPVWSGQPIKIHWGLPDPAAVEGDHSQRLAAFRETFDTLTRRMERMTALPIETLSPSALKDALEAIAEGELPA
ncbi:MAG: arsenate reductase ArsC [Pseudomonadota bacterium]|nr:arsenate reductase ArsC [Pseudomonadota bacterium]